MQFIRDYCVVKTKEILLDKIPSSNGKGGFLFVNPYFNPNQYTSVTGIVDSAPKMLSKQHVMGFSLGLPSHHDRQSTLFKHPAIESDQLTVLCQPGDKVYFHYNCLLPDDHEELYNKYYIKSRKEIENGEEVLYHYFRVEYMQIFAAVRYTKLNIACDPFEWWKEDQLKKQTMEIIDDDDKSHDDIYFIGDNMYRKSVTMCNTWVFIESDMETWDEISIPVPETINGVQVYDATGQPQWKPKNEWLVRKSCPTNRYIQGWVRFVGAPFLRDPEVIRDGDYVYFIPGADGPGTIISFEGKRYFRVIQRNIVGSAPFKRAS